MPRARNAIATDNRTAYEGGSQTRRAVGWYAPTVTPNGSLLNNLTTLRDRSRAAKRNDGYAHGAIETLVNEIIGTGIKPMSVAADAGFRAELQSLWTEWTDESDADGQLDFYGQQAQAVRAWKEGGESFTRLRPRLPGDGLTVPLQIQILEPELCPHWYSDFTKRTRAAIEFSPIGRRNAYYFHPSRPELDDWDTSQMVRIPATSICHLYDPLRPGQLRGLPLLTPALITLNEIDKLEDAVLLRQQLSNMYMSFLTRPQTIGDGSTTNPLTGDDIDRDIDARPIYGMEPGTTQELDPGEEFKFSDPPDPPQTLPDFMRLQMMRVAAGTRVPYEILTGDLSKVNDRTVRVILQTFRRQLQRWQHQHVVYQFCRPVWAAFMDRVFLSGALSIPLEYLDDPRPWARVKWVPQGWPYIHPLQDVQAKKEEIRSGLTSRAAAVSEKGEDSEVIDREQAADNQRADQLALRYDSDARYEANASTPAAATAGASSDPQNPDPQQEEATT